MKVGNDYSEAVEVEFGLFAVCMSDGGWSISDGMGTKLQTCSSCGVNPDSSPKGRAGLRIREWTCSACGVTHDRDINAAMNILAAGHRRLVEGITVPLGR